MDEQEAERVAEIEAKQAAYLAVTERQPIFVVGEVSYDRWCKAHDEWIDRLDELANVSRDDVAYLLALVRRLTAGG